MGVPTGSYVVITPARNEAQPAAPGREPRRADGAPAALADRRQRLHRRDARPRRGARRARTAWIQVLRCRDETAGARRRDRPRLPGGLAALGEPAGRSSSISTPTSRSSPTTSRACSGLRRRPGAGDRERQRFEQVDGEWRQRYVTGDDRLGRRAGVPPRVPRRRPAAGAAPRLGRHRRAPGARGAAGTRDVPRPAVPPPPRGGRARRQPRARPDRAGPRRALHRLPPLLPRPRSLHHARREPAALAMIWGYGAAAIAREPRIDDEAAARRSCATSSARAPSRSGRAKPSGGAAFRPATTPP